jgi:hypothetical protein
VGQGEETDMKITKHVLLGLTIIAWSGTARAGEAKGTRGQGRDPQGGARTASSSVRHCYPFVLEPG